MLRFVTRSPLWLDEALSVNIAQLPLGQIPAALRHDGHPPLYYFLLHGWMALFGTGDVAVRALSGLFAVAALPLAWLVGRRRGGPLLAWLFVGVLALSPFALRYATETRMYSLLMLLVLVGYLLLDDVVRRGRGGCGRLVGLALVSGLAAADPLLVDLAGRRGRARAAVALVPRSPLEARAAAGRAVARHRRRRPALPAVAAVVPLPVGPHRHAVGRRRSGPAT